MGTIPSDKSAGESLNATEANKLRDIGYIVTLILGEDIAGATLPVPSYIKVSDAKLYKCDGNDQDKLEFEGFVISTSTTGNTVQLQTNGIVSGFSGLTPGARYYVQDTVGTIGTSVGTYEVYVGIAVSATQILIDKGPRAQMQYMGTTPIGVTSGNTLYSHPADARFAIITGSFSTGSGNQNSFYCLLAKVGSTSHTALFDGPSANDDGSYSLVWGASGITVTEVSDPNSDGSITGNIYWYR